ncbi:esterase-like activity of phytase family protein [Pseudomonas knackmussii]|uniref:Esterase-like activity of phytase family protein n=1 Tax=Pseudomonas knackmussii TaxID=65741 RepID=A0ABY4KSW0_9PSED|nr:esterase-like activity of phytase family protein [Pseudomonas knackmussii]UPQ82342.1 esterase-like activity of phytase family protein [Pseudomonas knackmussii]
MNNRWIALVFALAMPVWAAEGVAELELISEHPVEGIEQGNLSGLAWCGDGLWAISDRDDNRLYRLASGEGVWQATSESFELPPAPDTGLAWGMRVRTAISGMVRGGKMDFEGLSCDNLGNRYLASEAHAAVLRVSPAGKAEWLNLPDGLIRQARASGMLLDFNSMLEGIAVDPEAGRLWLAGERDRRGLMVMHRNQSSWQCTGGCVLLAEGGRELPPPALGDQPLPRRFAGLAFHQEKLFTLEPSAHQICRRNPTSGHTERCWSYAGTALTDPRRYDSPFGNAEALWVDAEGAWIGIDNNGLTRADGEQRPVIWRFGAPKGGWGAKQ